MMNEQFLHMPACALSRVLAGGCWAVGRRLLECREASLGGVKPHQQSASGLHLRPPPNIGFIVCASS
jgi:hypothetical protein